MPKPTFPPGALELLILKILSRGREHGWGIAQQIHVLSRTALKVEEGSLYPTLTRMTQRGWIKGRMGVSENNRQARFYTLTVLGKMKLKQEQAQWESFTGAMARVLGASG